MPEIEALQAPPSYGNYFALCVVAAPLLVFALGMLVASRRAIWRYLENAHATAQTSWPEVRTGVFVRAALALFMLLSLGAGSRVLITGPASARVLGAALTIVLFWRAGVWTAAAATRLRRYPRGLVANHVTPGHLGIVGFLASAAVWTTGLLLTQGSPGNNDVAQMDARITYPARGMPTDAPQSSVAPPEGAPAIESLIDPR